MKKLMIAAAIVCAVACAHAGTVSWTCTDVWGKDGNPQYTGNAYMFATASGYTTATIADAIIEAYSTAGASGLKTFLNENALGSSGTAVTWVGNEDPGYGGDYSVPSKSYSNAELGLAGSTSYTLFAVIFDDTTDKIGDGTNFFVTSDKTATTKSDAATQNQSFGLSSQEDRSKVAGNWNTLSSVPEPTSAMLLLLGVAGLALKRKHA